MTPQRLRTRLAAAAITAEAAGIAYRFWIGPWQRRWGATDAELEEQLPGDDLVSPPAAQLTRGITINAAPEEVWPWIVQLGADHGGFYSYDWLENLFGLGIHSADRIVPDWQQRSVGDLVYANRAGTGGWYVVALHPLEALVLKVANVNAGEPVRRDEGVGWEFLWTFALHPDGQDRTRLLVRERVAFDKKLTRRLFAPVSVVSFVMTRKMMLGIKKRAEAPAPAADRRRASQKVA